MRLSFVGLAIALSGCATQSPVESECRRAMPPGEYQLVESAKLKGNGLSLPLEEGAAVEQPLSLRSYYENWPEVSRWSNSPHPSVALFSTSQNGLALCQVPEVACSPTLTWLSLESGERTPGIAKVVERREGVCVVSQLSGTMSPHNKSLERTRAR